VSVVGRVETIFYPPWLVVTPPQSMPVTMKVETKLELCWTDDVTVNLPLLKRIGQPCVQNKTTQRQNEDELTTAEHHRTALCNEQDDTETERTRTHNCWTSSDSLVYRTRRHRDRTKTNLQLLNIIGQPCVTNKTTQRQNEDELTTAEHHRTALCIERILVQRHRTWQRRCYSETRMQTYRLRHLLNLI